MPDILQYVNYLESSPKQDDRQLYTAFRLLASELSKASKRIAQLEGAPVINTGGSNFAIKTIFLNDDKDVEIPTEAAPALLLYVVTHDATANVYTLTWPDPPFANFAQPFQGEDLVTYFFANKISSGLILPAQGKFGGFTP